MLSNKKLSYSDKEIMEKGARALIKELSYSGFLRFIRFMDYGGEDYRQQPTTKVVGLPSSLVD